MVSVGRHGDIIRAGGALCGGREIRPGGRRELLLCRASTLESVAEVLKVFLTDLQLLHLFDHRNEVCQRPDHTQRRGASGPDQSPCRSQNARILNRFQRHTAFVQLDRQHSIRTPHGSARARSRTIGIQKPAYILALLHPTHPCGSRNDGPLMVTVWQ